jgi:hypothetical protein
LTAKQQKITALCSVFLVFMICITWGISYITTINKIVIEETQIFHSCLHFTSYPKLSVSPSVLCCTSEYSYDHEEFHDLPKDIQWFFQKRSRFIQDFQKKYSALVFQEKEITTIPDYGIIGYITQIIPTTYQGQNHYTVIMVSEKLHTWYLRFNQDVQLKNIHLCPWVSFGNCIISLDRPDQFMDICLLMNSKSGFFTTNICKEQSEGFGFLQKPLQSVFNSEVLRYSTETTPYPSLFEPLHRNIFSFQRNLIRFTPVLDDIPILYQVHSAIMPFYPFFNSSIYLTCPYEI